MKSKKEARGPKIEVSGGGGIIVFGGALIATAVGAAVVALRARTNSCSKGKSRNRDVLDKDDQREQEAFSVDGSVGGQENVSEKGEYEGSEGGAASSIESGAEEVWPEEVIDQKKSFEFEGDASNEISEMTINSEDKVEVIQTEVNGIVDRREEEFSFESSVEIEEESSKDTEMTVETKEHQTEASFFDPIDESNASGKEFSFWRVDSSTSKFGPEQNLEEIEAALVSEEAKSETREEQEESCIEEEGEKSEEEPEIIKSSSAVLSADTTLTAKQNEQDDSQSAEANERKGELEIPEETDDNGEENFIKEQIGEVSVDNSGGNQGNAIDIFEIDNTCKNSEMINVDTRENQLESDADDFDRLVEESDAINVGRVEEEGDTIEQEKLDGLTKDDTDSEDFDTPSNEICENLVCSEIVHVEMEAANKEERRDDGGQGGLSAEIKCPVEEESEREGSMEAMNSPMEAKLVEFEMKEQQTSSDQNTETSGNRLVTLQEETEESHSTLKNPDIDADEASESLQGLEVHESVRLQEHDSASSTESEMKLQQETSKKTADVSNIRQALPDAKKLESGVATRGSEAIVTGMEKRMDSVLVGSLKAFLIVVALALSVGLLVFAHQDHLHHYNHRLPKIYRQLYQLLSWSYNRALGEF